MRRLLWVVAIAGIASAAVLVLRAVPWLSSYYEPAGRCITLPIDVEHPDPFAKLKLDRTIVGVAASGGGSRAAYLTAAVLRQIRASGFKLDPGIGAEGATSLLDQIDAFSAVSGASIAAAYFVANADALRRAEADDVPWTEYLAKVTQVHRHKQYWRAVRSPSFWARYLLTNYHHGLFARDDFKQTLFGETSLASLPERPALFLNAFDVGNRVRFVFSKHHLETALLESRDGLRREPHDLTSANDLAAVRIDPRSVTLADAVYASSAFPSADPNLAMRHCGSQILYQGNLIFLADGGLADNSGLMTLLTQLRTAVRKATRNSVIVLIVIDASLERVDPAGSLFEQRSIESRYPWENTFFGHARESIKAAMALLYDVVWKFVEAADVVTDQNTANWPRALTGRSGQCPAENKGSFAGLFESGTLALRPLVVRLGLRDLADPDFAARYAAWRGPVPEELQRLLADNDLPEGLAGLSRGLRERILRLDTDFDLEARSRKMLDLAAYLLVRGKLTADLTAWSTLVKQATTQAASGLSCPL
jgi:predicted acylesterase/phospholipase RssA